MEVLEMLKEQLNIEGCEFEEIKSEILRISGIFEREGIEINTQFQIGLYSHIVSFIRRMRTSEKIEPIDENILGEIDSNSIELAKEIAIPICNKYNADEDMSEIMLISIHVQTIKAMCRGGE
jgi:PRD domain protein (TIGR03582 family)